MTAPNQAMGLGVLEARLVYEVRPRKDVRGVDLISDVLPFGRLLYGEPNSIAVFEVIVGLNNLPTGYQCWVGIIEAHYVQQ